VREKNELTDQFTGHEITGHEKSQDMKLRLPIKGLLTLLLAACVLGDQDNLLQVVAKTIVKITVMCFLHQQPLSVI